MTCPHRVLVVEDHALFRRLICELLQESATVQVIGEAVDGLDAVRQAQALRPDVVVLDLSLPKLNGFEAASRIRALIPDVKLMFLTVEASLEVVEHAYRCGANGYVYKPRAQRDVLPTLDAIIRGAGFLSGGLERVAGGDSLASHRHHVLFYSSDEILIDGYSRFIARELGAGKAVVALMTEAHHGRLRGSLRASDIDLTRAIEERRYFPVNVGELLTAAINDGTPDPARFLKTAGGLVAAAERHAASQNRRVATCGEGTSIFWGHGHVEAAVHLEHLWDEYARSREMDLLCAYPLSAREGDSDAVTRLCAEHTAVEITEAHAAA